MDTETEPRLRSPIVFTLLDAKPDVRLKVFDDVEFHVHSVVLKMHSAFFRKFLNSPDKQNNSNSNPPSGPFKYEWVTKFDEGGDGWHLIAAPKDDAAYVLVVKSTTQEFKSSQQILFESFLFAMYNLPYSTEPETLPTLTSLADYYCSLPALSRTLDGAFFRSEFFMEYLLFGLSKDRLESLLQAAIKLRSRPLYRDCLTLSIGPWHDPLFKKFEDHTLRNSAQVIYNQVAAVVAKVHLDLLEHFAIDSSNNVSIEKEYSRFREIIRAVRQERTSRRHDTTHLSLPALYRAAISEFGIDSKIGFILGPILSGRLKLDICYRAGESPCRDHFLFVGIEDKDLPWDVAESDW